MIVVDNNIEAERRGRTQGVVWAAAWVAKYHGFETVSKEMLELWGTDINDARKNGCDAGDIKALKEKKVW